MSAASKIKPVNRHPAFHKSWRLSWIQVLSRPKDRLTASRSCMTRLAFQDVFLSIAFVGRELYFIVLPKNSILLAQYHKQYWLILLQCASWPTLPVLNFSSLTTA